MDEREKLQERYDDAAFALMMDECAEADGEAFLAEFRAAAEAGDLPEIPADMDRLFRDTIKREYAGRERKVRFRQFKRAAARVAVAVFAVIGILSTLVMTVDAFRIPVLNFIIEITDKYTAFQGPGGQTGNIIEESAMDHLVALLPEGYYQSNSSNESGVMFGSYKNGDGDVVHFVISNTDGIHNIDTEDAMCSEIELGDYKAYLIEKNGYRLIWVDEENTMYDIRATGFNKDAFLDLCYKLADYCE